ncbi:unnamed protein product [Acanthoscelides obtectus]|uniref:Uncharacterized protein n=1 Tax=Acanthoscelides obtectus TaxID=200917 RepID=A0A9P0K3Q9_ACAOB|nr:unnamed protein product [Acanthoscelides obtectus]CAK1646719.1 hypothetical protein AOBTE_LOCUS14838 [Acanthoscelides obtectus]
MSVNEMTTEEELHNITFDDDPFGEDYAITEDMWYYLRYYIEISVIIRLILSLFVIGAVIFLIVVLLRFKRLKIRTNHYILNMFFLYLSLYLVPLIYILFHFMFSLNSSGIHLLQTIITAVTLYITLAFMLGLDWFVFAWKPHLESTYNKYFKYVLLGTYSVFGLEWAVAFCYDRLEHIILIRPLFFTIVYLIYAVTLIVLNVLKRRISLAASSKKTQYALTVSNITIFSFLPLLIFHAFSALTGGSLIFYFFMALLEPFLSIIAISHPIYIVYRLGRDDKYFKMAYNKSFKRSVRNYNDDDLDVSVDDDSSKVQVNFNNETRIHINK